MVGCVAAKRRSRSHLGLISIGLGQPISEVPRTPRIPATRTGRVANFESNELVVA